MKASDAIIELQSLIDIYGDLDVKYYDCSFGLWRDPLIYCCTDSIKEDEEPKDFIAFDIA